jgi:hypothetical protein
VSVNSIIPQYIQFRLKKDVYTFAIYFLTEIIGTFGFMLLKQFVVQEAADSERRGTFLNLTAFKKILINVMNIDKFKPLINQHDHEIIFNFIKLPEESKALLVHLSSVKIQWRRISSMKYPELNIDLNVALEPLIEDKFLVTDDGIFVDDPN